MQTPLAHIFKLKVNFGATIIIIIINTLSNEKRQERWTDRSQGQMELCPEGNRKKKKNVWILNIIHYIQRLPTSTSSSLTLLFKLSFCTLNDSFILEISFTLLSRLCKYFWENKHVTDQMLHVNKIVHLNQCKFIYTEDCTALYLMHIMFISGMTMFCLRKTPVFV